MRSEDEKQAGLCAHCAHGSTQRSARGSTFWRCLRAETDGSYRRYPALPVADCAGFERASANLPDSGGARRG